MRWLAILVLLGMSGCCDPFKIKERETRKREFEELLQKKKEEAAVQRAEEDAKKWERFKAEQAEQAEQNKAIEKAKAQDSASIKAMRKPFANKVKAEAQCASAEVEGPDSDTLHVEGCEALGAPVTNPALFQEAKNLGFYRIHNHSQGKALCSYYLSRFPAQKVWKCSVDAWPGL